MTFIAKMPETAKARDRVAPAKISHMVLRTRPERVAALREWYQCVLEAEPMCVADRIVFLTYDQEHHRIAIIGEAGLKDRADGQIGFHHLAFTYGELGDLVHTYERLKGHGITPELTLNHGPTTSMYYFDPDRNRIELQVDNVPEEKFAEYFENGEFAANQVGVLFDADELAARYHAGEPVEVLLKRPAGTAPDPSRFPAN